MLTMHSCMLPYFTKAQPQDVKHLSSSYTVDIFRGTVLQFSIRDENMWSFNLLQMTCGALVLVWTQIC